MDCYKQTAGKPKAKVAETNSMWTVKQELKTKTDRLVVLKLKKDVC